MDRRPRVARPRLLALSILVGAFLGLSLATFDYAEGLSYFSTDPAACANCHIMQSQYDGWQKSSHHTAAKCVDCHLPHEFFAKYLAKAENGWRHGKEFSLDTFAEPIALKPRSSEILQANCRRCHGSLVEAVAGSTSESPVGTCVHCHQSVGHGTRAALGGPLRARELAHMKVAPPNPTAPLPPSSK